MYSLVLVLIVATTLCTNIANSLPVQDTAYSEITYPGIGTFTSNDFYDETIRPVVFLPQSPEHINTKFLLHTRLNTKDHQDLFVHNLDSIKKSHFDPSHPTKFIIHGFIDNQLFGEWMKTLKDEFLKLGDYNVIIVDWSGGNGLPYGQATANTRVVGPVIAMLIEDLVNATGADLSSFHLLGHSLGSHVAGYAGERLKSLGRITGLDPAGPYFEGLPPAGRLDPSDAVFVDAIHTDAKHLLPDLGFGMYETSGHIDFYPNGGKDQPGCDVERFTTIFTEGLVGEARRLVACNHQRAIDFYTASLNHKDVKPVSYQCDDYQSFLNGKCTDCGTDGEKCAILGAEVESWSKFRTTNSGHRFFMSTGSQYPYFQFEYELKIKLTPNHPDQHGTMSVTIYAAHVISELSLIGSAQDFHQGSEYNFIVKSDTDYGTVTSVTLNWHHLLGIILKYKIYVDNITIVPLTSPNIMDRAKHAAEIKVLCQKTPSDGVENDKGVEFRACV